ncbi:hypothetical protein EVAR_60718_1 [Eumeta japonica]|uniref:Uncharacterized protein n=1 Tax=Eumeta variegata TaxID=151549 RepID=A0A4C1ZE97_EUMVA|nr:hypothetical protein EVAR_60718_1 [Eumeta japonica]
MVSDDGDVSSRNALICRGSSVKSSAPARCGSGAGDDFRDNVTCTRLYRVSRGSKATLWFRGSMVPR